jgi:hypothetical protein
MATTDPVPANALDLAGVAPTVVVARTVSPPAGEMAYLGTLPTASVSSPVAVAKSPATDELTLDGLTPTIAQAEIGPVAVCWGSEALVVARISTDTLVSAGIGSDTLEYLS